MDREKADIFVKTKCEHRGHHNWVFRGSNGSLAVETCDCGRRLTTSNKGITRLDNWK
jgi:ribosomal protein S27E